MDYRIIYIALFVVCFFFSINIDGGRNRSKYWMLLPIACVALALGAGFRDWLWLDTYRYIDFFCSHKTATLETYSFSERPYGYPEKGFYFLSVLVKTVTNDITTYLLFISAITMSLLYIDIRKYSLYPLLGLCCYVSRFFCGRNLVQMRAGMSYLIVIWGLHYVYKRDLLKYFLVIYFASLFHQSAWIALPFYFICNTIELKKNHIYVGLVIAFILGAFFQGPISAFVTDSATDFDVATTYVQGRYVEEAKGLKNPMIYFQVVVLLLYVFLEKRIAKNDSYYYVFRNGYWYSTLILITFCTFTTLSGRTSSLFATLEFVIIPSLLFHFPKNYRIIAYLSMGFVLTFFLWKNMNVGFRFGL